MLLRVTAALFLLTMVTYSGVRMASGLTCYSCTNWDNTSRCLDPEADYFNDIKIETCNTSWEVGRKKAFCLTEVQYDCQSTVFKDSNDLVGNGGGIYKRWVRLGCAFIDVSKEPLKSHRDCYWVRKRSARDVLHQTTGFQVIARSSIHRKCYCNDEDNCNYVRVKDSACDRECGPQCKQVSRDECVLGLTESTREWPRDHYLPHESTTLSTNMTTILPGVEDTTTTTTTPRNDDRKTPDSSDRKGVLKAYGGMELGDPYYYFDYYNNQRLKRSFYDAAADDDDEYLGEGLKSSGHGATDNRLESNGPGGVGMQSGECKCWPSNWPEDRDNSDHVATERIEPYVPTEREFVDCGIDHKRMTPTMIGGRTYRHIGTALGSEDGVRGSVASRKRVPVEMLGLSIAVTFIYYLFVLYDNFSCRMSVNRVKRILLLRQTQ